MDLTDDQVAAWERLREYDLLDVERWFAEKTGVPRAFAEECSDELRRYFFLAFLAGERNGMTACPVDQFWHFFLTFTPTYRRFVEETVGWFVNHNPGLYWRPDMRPEAQTKHVFAARLYHEVFGIKPPTRLWLHLEAGLTDEAVMPGGISAEAEILTLEGPRPVRTIRPGDVVVGADGEPGPVEGVTCWPIADNRALRYPNAPWFFSANLIVHLGPDGRLDALDRDGVRDANGATFKVDGRHLVNEAEFSFTRDLAGHWAGEGVVEAAPSRADLVYFLLAPRGFVVRGGLACYGNMGL